MKFPHCAFFTNETRLSEAAKPKVSLRTPSGSTFEKINDKRIKIFQTKIPEFLVLHSIGLISLDTMLPSNSTSKESKIQKCVFKQVLKK